LHGQAFFDAGFFAAAVLEAGLPFDKGAPARVFDLVAAVVLDRGFAGDFLESPVAAFLAAPFFAVVTFLVVVADFFVEAVFFVVAVDFFAVDFLAADVYFLVVGVAVLVVAAAFFAVTVVLALDLATAREAEAFFVGAALAGAALAFAAAGFFTAGVAFSFAASV